MFVWPLYASLYMVVCITTTLCEWGKLNSVHFVYLSPILCLYYPLILYTILILHPLTPLFYWQAYIRAKIPLMKRCHLDFHWKHVMIGIIQIHVLDTMVQLHHSWVFLLNSVNYCPLWKRWQGRSADFFPRSFCRAKTLKWHTEINLSKI